MSDNLLKNITQQLERLFGQLEEIESEKDCLEESEYLYTFFDLEK